jgi:FkbM family methyltransferase
MSSLESLRKSHAANFFRGYWHILRPPVRPTQSLPLLQRVSRYKIDMPRKLLHIGANNGGEAGYYAQNGIEAWHVEAIPDVYQRLVENCSSKKSQHPILACLSRVEGEQVNFNISSNSGLSSSLLELGRHGTAYPSIYYEQKISLTTTTVDHLIAEGHIPPDIDFLVIDAQGAELLVLQGAQTLLSSGSLKGAMIETAVEPLYDGGATYIDISAELKSHGLYLCEAAFNLDGWCDAIYAQRYWP